MLALVKSRQVERILVKDLSRLGRNYIETGRFIDLEFPRYNIHLTGLTLSATTTTAMHRHKNLPDSMSRTPFPTKQLPQYLTNRFQSDNKLLLIICAVIFVVAYCIYAASSISACGTLFNTVMGIDRNTAMIGAAVIIIVYP